jgi:hypothetical protein
VLLLVSFKKLVKAAKIGQFPGLNMGCSIFTYLKKTFSLSLILNSLITLATISGILYGFYHEWPNWKPYAPYLINGNLFWVVVAAALINIFPSAAIGRCLHTGRLWFHHYVYGFFVLISSAFFIIAFTSVSLIMLFLINSSNLAVNAGRFFVLTGLTLFLDDLPDVSKRVESVLNKIKAGFCHIRKAIHFLQLGTGIVSFYVFVAVALSFSHKASFTVSNCLTMGTFLITSITSFACFRRGAWLKITPVQ